MRGVEEPDAERIRPVPPGTDRLGAQRRDQVVPDVQLQRVPARRRPHRERDVDDVAIDGGADDRGDLRSILEPCDEDGRHFAPL